MKENKIEKLYGREKVFVKAVADKVNEIIDVLNELEAIENDSTSKID